MDPGNHWQPARSPGLQEGARYRSPLSSHLILSLDVPDWLHLPTLAFLDQSPLPLLALSPEFKVGLLLLFFSSSFPLPSLTFTLTLYPDSSLSRYLISLLPNLFII